MALLSDNATEITKKRYFSEGENWEGLCRRVGSTISLVEENKSKWADIFSEEIYNMNFLPGGRILRSSGKIKSSLLNCGCLPIADSIESIGDTIRNALVLWAYGAGIGIDFSPLREEGRPLATRGGIASGMLSFIKAINSIASTIETGGQRRSGCLGMCKVSHPEIYKFIDAKRKDGDLNYFNLSVAIDSSFIKAVEDDEDWNLTFAGQKVKTVKAVDLWNRILDSMIKTGEPGLINYDNLTKNNSYYFQNIECCNLCQPSWATIATKKGIRTIDEIGIGDSIWSTDGWTRVTRKINRGIREVFKYKTTSNIFYGTEDHRIISNGDKIEVDNAESIDSITVEYSNKIDLIPEYIMDGIVLGDGSVHKASNNLVYLLIGKDDYDYFDSEISNLILKHRPGLKDTAYEIKTNITYKELPYTYLRKIPKRYKFGNRNVVASFLRGVYTANGSVVTPIDGRARIQLASSSEQLIEDVQLMLSFLGIRSYITKDGKRKTKFKNGVYECRESYILNITWDREKFYSIIGFIQEYKNDILLNTMNKPFSKHCSFNVKKNFDIIEKELISEEQVYSITVDNESHTYWSGGCSVENCSELPLPAYGLCCLGSLVLPNFLSGRNTNWKKLENTIKIAVRFLDNVLDVNFYPIKQTELVTKDSRRIGLGVMGLHDMLMIKQIKYGSERSILEIERLFKFIRDTAYLASVEIAEEKGSFPRYLKNEYMSSSFVRKLPPKIRMEIRNHGIRNCCMLSAPPTGTSSLIADVSSGIEPIFSLAYTRKDRVSERIYIHPLYKEWIESGVLNKPEWLIDTSHLTPEHHLDIQVSIQKYLDNATSKTINCPSNITRSELSDLLLEYIKDLVGVTIYVDGSKKGQILNRLTDEETRKILSSSKKINKFQSEEDVACKSGTCDI